MQQQPDWTSLPAELWQRVAEHVAGGIQCSIFPSATLSILDTRGQSTRWLRTVACLSSVSWDLREALLGSEAATLWSNLSFHSTRLKHPQSMSMNR